MSTGEPYSKTKARARYLMEDFSDAECRKILDRLIETAPQQASAAIAEHWETNTEVARKHRFNDALRKVGVARDR